jgi:hypothetical protein
MVGISGCPAWRRPRSRSRKRQASHQSAQIMPVSASNQRFQPTRFVPDRKPLRPRQKPRPLPRLIRQPRRGHPGPGQGSLRDRLPNGRQATRTIVSSGSKFKTLLHNELCAFFVSILPPGAKSCPASCHGSRPYFHLIIASGAGTFEQTSQRRRAR